MPHGTEKVTWERIRSAAFQRFSNEPRPFLKWAGSKQALLPHLLDLIPTNFNTYYEPFLGGGALFFLLEPSKAILSDACEPLIETFKAVRDNPSAVLRLLNGRKISKTAYYETRNNPGTGRFRKASDFIYLNKTCWNGLYRVNSNGGFNVPFGHPRSNQKIVDASNLHACSEALSKAKISVVDFGKAVEDAKKGDFVYFDPPYVTGHNNNGFRDWNETLFSWSDQERLARVARVLANRGVHVVVSNAHHSDILKLYKGFKSRSFYRSSTLASAPEKRGVVQEVIFFSA